MSRVSCAMDAAIHDVRDVSEVRGDHAGVGEPPEQRGDADVPWLVVATIVLGGLAYALLFGAIAAVGSVDDEREAR